MGSGDETTIKYTGAEKWLLSYHHTPHHNEYNNTVGVYVCVWVQGDRN